MSQFPPIVPVLATLLWVHGAFGQTSVTTGNAAPPEDVEVERAKPPLPALPAGRATVIGGTVSRLDPVRDRFTLRVYGGQPLKVLFDARTELYRDGVRAPLRSLRPDERASVETTLDGDDVFALRVHVLSKAPEGDCRGQVTRLDTAAELVEVRCDLTGDPVLFHFSQGAAISILGQDPAHPRAGQPADLMQGSLVRVTFRPGERGEGVATKVDLIAAPGQVFTFTGTIAAVNAQAGHLVIADPRDGATYNIAFNPAHFPESGNFREGVRASVTAGFDGKGYTASVIRLE